jgi:hypothetical protein
VVSFARSSAERNCVGAAEQLEQKGLTFNDRHAGLRANIAEPEYARTIRYDSGRIATIDAGKRRISISYDRAAWFRHDRRVSDGKVGQNPRPSL